MQMKRGTNTYPYRLLLSGDIETNPGPTTYRNFKGSKVTLMKLRNCLFLNDRSVNKCHSFLYSEKCTRLTVSYSSQQDSLHTSGVLFKRDGTKKHFPQHHLTLNLMNTVV